MPRTQSVIEVGVARDDQDSFRAFLGHLTAAPVSSERTSAAGGLDITIFKIVLESQFVWGLVLGYLVHLKYVELFLKDGTRVQPAMEDVKELEKLVRGPETRRSLPAAKVVARKRPTQKRARTKARRKPAAISLISIAVHRGRPAA